MPFNMQGWEWVILVVVALLIFGGSRLAGAGRNAGRAIREFKEETRSIKADEEKAKAERAAGATAAGEIHADRAATDRVVDAEIVEPHTDPKPDTRA